MNFRESKCSCIVEYGGKVTAVAKPIVKNNVNINPIKEEDSCKYPGQDENFGYVETVNK